MLTMKHLIFVFAISMVHSAEVRLENLDPPEAQQYINQQDTSLKYAPKIESNVPAVRYLGNEPHNVLEDLYLINQYHGQDGLGGYLYGYNVPDIAKTEKKIAGGELRGSYQYLSEDGKEIKVEYWDDGKGFHQIDNLPKGPPTESPEIQAARDEHMRLWREEAERNSRPPQNPYDNSVQGSRQQNYPVPHPAQNVQYYRDQQYQGQQSQQYQRTVNSPQAQNTIQSHNSPVYRPEQKQSNDDNENITTTDRPNYNIQAQASQPSSYRPGASVSGSVNYGTASASGSANYGASASGSVNYGASGAQSVSQYQRSLPGRSSNIEHNTRRYDEEEKEETGPPKGFFYNIEYPAGIIVQKGDAIKKRQVEDVKNIYETNKDNFEKQLQEKQGKSSSYMVVN